MNLEASGGPGAAGLFSETPFPATKADLLGLVSREPGLSPRKISLMPDHTYQSRAEAVSEYQRTAPEELDGIVAALGPWFHNLHLPDATQTAPDHFLGDFPRFKWQSIKDALPSSLDGWSVLDIGCNAGFYAIELAKRGASVTAIDSDPHYLAQARFAARTFGLSSRIRLQEMQVYDLVRVPETYDLVLFMGVFYHLRYPLLGLDIAASKVRRLMLFQTLTMPGEEVMENTLDRPINDRDDLLLPGWPKMAFIEHSFVGDPTNWWLANHAGVEAMVRSAGLRILSRPEHEFYLCEPDPDNPSCVTTWNAGEFQAATNTRTVQSR